MNILLAVPIFENHWTSGHFWLKAFSQLGHYVCLWDYRLQPDPPNVSYDFAFVHKGYEDTPSKLKGKKVCIWPDAPERTPNIRALHAQYDAVFMSNDPSASWAYFLPGVIGWDPDIHKPVAVPKTIDTIFFGTATARKQEFLRAIRPTMLVGNGWGSNVSPAYLWDLIHLLSASRVSINVHPNTVGPNGRLFESMACTFTLTDIVPGVAESIGSELAEKLGFRTPEEGRDKVEYYLGREKEREELFLAGREAIRPHTYLEAAKKVLEVMSCV